MMDMEDENLGAFKMPFGKYQGEELQVIWLADKEYLYWCVKEFQPGQTKDAIEKFLEEMG